jgi:hypothetical protein
MEVTLPKGSRGLSVNHATLPDQSSIPAEYREARHALDREAEVLLPSNTRHRITSIEERVVDGKTYQWVKAELEPPAAATPTAAKTRDFSMAALTRHSEDELMDMVGQYADDPDALDAIFAAIDHKAEVGVATHFDDLPDTAGDTSVWGDASLYLDKSPATNPVKRTERKLSRDEQVGEEFDAYVSTSYARALDYTAGNFIKASMKEEAKRRGYSSGEALFTGPVAVARKFASEELIAYWSSTGGRRSPATGTTCFMPPQMRRPQRSSAARASKAR